MPLKFLRLPQLIQSEIMDNLLPEEIFLLSLCSQKSFKALQSNFRKSKKLKITVDVSTSLRAGYNLNGQNGQFIEFMNYLPNFGRSFESVTIGGNRMTIQYYVWENTWETKLCHDSSNVKLVMDHIARLFRHNVHHVEIYGRPQRQRIEVDVYFGFRYGLTSLQSPNSLQINLDLSKMISWDTVDHLDTNVAIPTDALNGVRKTIWLKDASFVTLDDLMSMNQIEIYLEKSKLTSADINIYLTSWMEKRGCSQLKLFQCQMEKRVNKNTYEGLRVENAEMKEYTSLREDGLLRLPTGTRLRFQPDFELQRSDGATVAGKCGDKKVTLLFYPPKSELEQRQTTQK